MTALRSCSMCAVRCLRAVRKQECIFRGRIRVDQVAQKTDAFQICRTLMLSDKARVTAMPSLEITADDVKCAHGATITDLDEVRLVCWCLYLCLPAESCVAASTLAAKLRPVGCSESQMHVHIIALLCAGESVLPGSTRHQRSSSESNCHQRLRIRHDQILS